MKGALVPMCTMWNSNNNNNDNDNNNNNNNQSKGSESVRKSMLCPWLFASLE